ncbi:hypothetical protein [Spirosoma gilvum]
MTETHKALLPDWFSLHREPWTKSPETPLAPLYQFSAEVNSKEIASELYRRGTTEFFGDFLTTDEKGKEIRNGIFIDHEGDLAHVVVFPYRTCLGYARASLLSALALHPNNPLRSRYD